MGYIGPGECFAAALDFLENACLSSPGRINWDRLAPESILLRRMIFLNTRDYQAREGLIGIN
ncbi:MAG: hypothetical protein ACLQVD_03050, partial [Capsulimonadaceae bacterium]